VAYLSRPRQMWWAAEEDKNETQTLSTLVSSYNDTNTVGTLTYTIPEVCQPSVSSDWIKLCVAIHYSWTCHRNCAVSEVFFQCIWCN